MPGSFWGERHGLMENRDAKQIVQWGDFCFHTTQIATILKRIEAGIRTDRRKFDCEIFDLYMD